MRLFPEKFMVGVQLWKGLEFWIVVYMLKITVEMLDIDWPLNFYSPELDLNKRIVIASVVMLCSDGIQ